jgi:hypothetical protein
MGPVKITYTSTTLTYNDTPCAEAAFKHLLAAQAMSPQDFLQVEIDFEDATVRTVAKSGAIEQLLPRPPQEPRHRC